MQLIPQPQDNNPAMKFKLGGFPDDALLTSALENFYRGKNDLPRSFIIYNMFDELIFTGQMAEDGRLANLESKPRTEDSTKYKKEE